MEQSLRYAPCVLKLFNHDDTLQLVLAYMRQYVSVCRNLKIEHLKKRAQQDLQKGNYKAAHTKWKI